MYNVYSWHKQLTTLDIESQETDQSYRTYQGHACSFRDNDKADVSLEQFRQWPELKTDD